MKKIILQNEQNISYLKNFLVSFEFLQLSTKDLETKDLEDFYTTESTGFGFSTTVGKANTSQGKSAIAPEGSTSISMTNTGSEKEQTTFATIGNGNIVVGGDSNSDSIVGLNRNVNNSQVITKDEKDGEWDIDMNINLLTVAEIIQAGGLKNYTKGQAKELKQNTVELGKEVNTVVENVYDTAEKIPGGEVVAKTLIGTTVGGVASAFGEDSRTKDVYVVNGKTYDTWDEAIADNPGAKITAYNMGGVDTGLDGAISFSEQHSNTIVRVNETDGLVGDVIEAGISDLLGLTNWTADLSALGRMQAEDMYNTATTVNSIRNYNTHSEGTIAFANGLKVYANEYKQADGTISDADRLKLISYNALGYATYQSPVQKDFDLVKSNSSDDEYKVNFDKYNNDPIAALAAPTLTNNIFTILIKSAARLDPTFGIKDHYESNHYYDKYFK